MEAFRLRLVAWLPVALAACGGGGGGGPRPLIRTVAYVDTECHEDATTQTYSAQQMLQILNGDRPLVTLPMMYGVSHHAHCGATTMRMRWTVHLSPCATPTQDGKPERSVGARAARVVTIPATSG